MNVFVVETSDGASQLHISGNSVPLHIAEVRDGQARALVRVTVPADGALRWQWDGGETWFSGPRAVDLSCEAWPGCAPGDAMGTMQAYTQRSVAFRRQADVDRQKEMFSTFVTAAAKFILTPTSVVS